LTASGAGGGGGGGGTPPPGGGGGGTPPPQLTPQDEREDSVHIIGRVIHATHDMAPYPAGQNTPVPFMYWDSIAPNAVFSDQAVAAALIKRLVVVFMSPLLFYFRYLLVFVYKTKADTKTTKHLFINAAANVCLQLQTFVFGFYIFPFLFDVLFNVIFNVLF
jgi:hypothetical protein